MNYKLINKKAFDVPNFRLSLSLPIIFLSFLFFGVIFGFATEGKIEGIIYPISIVIGIIAILLLISFMIYIFTLKKIIFTKDNITINGIDYQWHNIKIYYYDKHEIISLKWNTICIEYFNIHKGSFMTIYIRCKIDDYNNIMAIRN